jgi:hypothetical protein
MLEIIRIEEGKDGTFGVLKLNGQCYCLTLELPDKCNQRNISSIPRGDYICLPIVSPKYGFTYMVSGVNGRSGILFHTGNTVEDSKGCILVGASFGFLGRRAVISSRATFDRLIRELGDAPEVPLKIRECYS